MRILIVGSGKVGHTLAANLTDEGHDVVVIDRSETAIAKCDEELDVLPVQGSGTSGSTLKEAGVDKADILVATMATDEQNMLCSMIAHRYGSPYTIARVRDPDYAETLLLLQKDLGIDTTINPERLTAQEISRLLRYPFGGTIQTFAKGRVELVDFRAQDSDPMVGVPVREIGRTCRNLPQVLYAAVERGGEVIVPNGDFVIKAGDRVYIAGELTNITAFFRELQRNTTRIRNVLVLGGGRISYYLTKIIAPLGIHVTIMEIDPAKAARLSELLDEANVLCADGTDHELLEKEGLTHFDAFVTLGSRDEDNLMTGLYAVKRGVKKVIAKNSRDAYSSLLSGMGLESLISPVDITCSTITRYVRERENRSGTGVEKLYRLLNGKAEALEFIARAGDSYIGVPLKQLKLRQNSLIAVIVHKNRVIVPFGDDVIEAGDNVIAICRDGGVNDLNEVIQK